MKIISHTHTHTHTPTANAIFHHATKFLDPELDHSKT